MDPESAGTVTPVAGQLTIVESAMCPGMTISASLYPGVATGMMLLKPSLWKNHPRLRMPGRFIHRWATSATPSVPVLGGGSP